MPKKPRRNASGGPNSRRRSGASLLTPLNAVVAVISLGVASFLMPASPPTAARRIQGPGPGSELYSRWLADSEVPGAWRGGAALDTAWLRSNHSLAGSPALEKCAPQRYLSTEVRAPGFHVLCVLPAEAAAGADAVARVAVFKHGLLRRRADATFVLRRAHADGGWASLVDFLSHKLVDRPRADARFQRMGLFTAFGRRLHGGGGVGAAFERPAVLAFEGGQWIWPAVKIGHTVALGELRTKGETTFIKTVSLKPRVFEVLNFLKSEESDAIQQRAAPHVSNSGVSVKDVDKGKAVETWRTSSTHFLSSSGFAPLQKVEQRVQRLTRINVSHAEDVQVLRYDLAGRYLAHNDFFDPKDYKGDPGTMRLIQNGAKNRLATVFFYLNDVPRGGHTGFPRAGGLPIPMKPNGEADYGNCKVGIQVAPKKNKVIIFYSLHPDGSLDHHSLHGGCPVKEGVKWSANFWLWNKAFPMGMPHRAKMAVAHQNPTTAEDDAIENGDYNLG